MEKFTQWMEAKKHTKERRPVKASCTGPSISNLLFANDVILFAKAAMDQINLIKHGEESFCKASRQKVSFNKFHVYFFLSVPEAMALHLSSRLGIPPTDVLGKYLGFHL